ncbi:MAG: LysM peptidoglycan-binding domain-containing protein, partial [Anaerolineales bacterium]
MNTKRLLLYLALNALVSASVTLTVLWLWDRSSAARSPEVNAPTALAGDPATALATNPSPAPAAETATPTVYIVRAGDSLSSIAQQFDVAVEELMLANGLTDPNVLS